MPMSLCGLEDKRGYCVRKCFDCCAAWVKERSPVCGAGREHRGPQGARCRKGSNKMSIGARPTTRFGDGSTLLA